MEDIEIWKANFEYPNYEISNLGRIRHIKYKKARKVRARTGKEYLTIELRNKDGKLKSNFVHRLVAKTFLGNHTDLIVDHINRNPIDNRLINLRWISQKENIYNRSKRSKYSEEIIDKIIKLYKSGLSTKDIKIKI